MPSPTADDQLGEAILDFVQHGVYPESDKLVSAELPPSALHVALDQLKAAREDVKVHIRKASNGVAPDVDGWILQAKQLRLDIDLAQQTSKRIVSQAQELDEERQEVDDISNKLRLLESEVGFNKSLEATLELLRAVHHSLQQTKDLIVRYGIEQAIDVFLQAVREHGSAQGSRNTRVFALLRDRIGTLREDINSAIGLCWAEMISTDQNSLKILNNFDSKGGRLEIVTVASGIERLGLLDRYVTQLCRTLEKSILTPRLEIPNSGNDSSLIFSDSHVIVSEQSSDTGLHHLFSDLQALIRFLQKRLPSSFAEPLLKLLIPKMVSLLIRTRLLLAIPEDLEAMLIFQETYDQVSSFSEALGSFGMPGRSQLDEWARRVPQSWLEKRQETCLNKVRQILRKSFGSIQTVEREETQVISQQDDIFSRKDKNEDWNAGWSDEESISQADKAAADKITGSDNDEEDVSAWGLDDDTQAEEFSGTNGYTMSNDDDADAWGWGNEANVVDISKASKTVIPNAAQSKVNGGSKPDDIAPHKVTLRETYKITSIPQEILASLNDIIFDIDRLGGSRFHGSPITTARSGLVALPGLVLVMYRASAQTYYSINNSGSMFLYNDCLWLAEKLRQFVQERVQNEEWGSRDPVSYFRLEDDIAAIEVYGKRAYSKEMESQKTIIKDLLDGAQGFANCTEALFSQECDLAIRSIVDRIRDLHRQWKDVLSHSALLQSLGSLLTTVIDKIIIDVEDMNDISEPESQRLTTYCRQVIALEDIFMPQHPVDSPSNNEDTIALTAVYTRGWFKFQYLSEILDSSLIDIKYLWTDGGLKLEYDTEEVVELIEALFADSEHRRRAIGEIRRSSGR